MSEKKPWWYRPLQWLDGYWHVYVCNLVEKHADADEEQPAPRTQHTGDGL